MPCAYRTIATAATARASMSRCSSSATRRVPTPIRTWTGLTDDRIRKLYRSYLCGSHERGAGPASRQIAAAGRHFSRAAAARARRRRCSRACAACSAPCPYAPGAASCARSLACLARAELLCQAYEIYRGLIRQPLISFEHAVFLLTTLARGDELLLGACRDCGAALIVDRWSLRAPRCGLCADHSTVAPTTRCAGLEIHDSMAELAATDIPAARRRQLRLGPE